MRKPKSTMLPSTSTLPLPIKSDPQIYERLGRRLAEAREVARLTQEQLGGLVSESAITISRWENASRRPTVDDVMKLAEALERDIYFFLEEEPEIQTSVQQLNRAVGQLPQEDVDELLAIARIKQKRYAAQRLAAATVESEDDR
ncbi:helix-turn-helix domain-containing protein [Deinococcus wulumuqiensis]